MKVTEAQAAQARKAVAEFRKLLPSFNAYARALSRKSDLRVSLSQGGTYTDGKTIFFQPPFELGATVNHIKRFCGERYADQQPRCPACLIREKMLVNIYHELGHVIFDTFTEPSYTDIHNAATAALDLEGSAFARGVRDRIENAKHLRQLSGLISPYLSFIDNALEDVRVDSAMFEARNGLRKMFYADNMRIMTGQESNLVGEKSRWQDRALNSQAMVALYFMGMEYADAEFFSPPVRAVVTDAALREICIAQQTAKSASDTFQNAVRALVRLRELGFCRNPDSPSESDDEPIEEPQPDESDDTADPDSDSGDSSDSPAGDTSSDDSPADDDEGSDDEPGSPGMGDSVPDSAPDQSEEGESGEAPEGDGYGEAASQGEGEGESVDADRTDESEGSDTSDSGNSDSGGDNHGGDSVDPEVDREPEAPAPSEEEADLGDEAAEAGRSDGDAESDSSEQATDSTECDADDQPGEGESEASAPDSSDSSGGSAGDGSSDGSGGSEELDAREGDRDASPDEPEPKAEGVDHGEENSSGGDDPQGSAEESDGDPGDGGEVDSSNGSHAPDDASDDSDRDAPATGPGDGDDAAEAGDPRDESPPEEDEGFTLSYVEMLPPQEDREAWGDADQVEDETKTLDHATQYGQADQNDNQTASQEIATAVIQGEYFATPSSVIQEVNIYRGGDGPSGFNQVSAIMSNPDHKVQTAVRELGIDSDVDMPESVLGPAVMVTRRIFEANERAAFEFNRRNGRVNSRVLGRRAWSGDPRLFQKKSNPGRKDYSVLIGIDISGSTSGGPRGEMPNIALAKRAAMAQAELCHRTGIKFGVYAHTGRALVDYKTRRSVSLDIYELKGFDDPWSKAERERLELLAPSAANLDGHTLEYYRKMMDRRPETDRIIMYYSDGHMPAENYDEELDVLQREIRLCATGMIHLMGVGIRCTSPADHGLPTVRVDEDADLQKVVRFLGDRLNATARR